MHHILPCQSGATEDVHNLSSIPARESHTLEGSILIDCTCLFRPIVKNTASLRSLLFFDLDPFRGCRPNGPVDRVRDELAFPDCHQVLPFQGSPRKGREVLGLQGRAGSQAALPTTDAVSSWRMVWDVFHQFLGALAGARINTCDKSQVRSSKFETSSKTEIPLSKTKPTGTFMHRVSGFHDLST